VLGVAALIVRRNGHRAPARGVVSHHDRVGSTLRFYDARRRLSRLRLQSSML
jgi:hypothetical protein